jgi:peptidoglycan/xylan/chitin deacetylase (PgdA/CDA1 family)
MRLIHDQVLRTGLDALYYTGLHHLMAGRAAGRGCVFALHRVLPAPAPSAFAPNRGLEVTPEFLAQVLEALRRRDVDVVDLDEALHRLQQPDARRFAVFTFDDGYADSLRATLPVFERFEAPFTLFVTTGLIDGTADIWWLLLEAAIARLDKVSLGLRGEAFDLPAGTAKEKQAVWDTLYWRLRDLPKLERQHAVASLGTEAGIDSTTLCASVAAGWDELRAAAQHRLVTLGAHTLTHPPLASLSEEDAYKEMAEGRRRLEAQTGQPVRHFAYPFGDRSSAGSREFQLARELGFATAVTTRRGPLFTGHAGYPHAWPRVSLNGNFQAARYISLFLSGAPFVLWNRGRQLDVA